jgi:ABC-type amino acid transport system permease subunit
VIAYEELTKAAQDVQGSFFLTFEPWLTVAVLYLGVNMILSFGVRVLERKLGTESDRGDIR